MKELCIKIRNAMLRFGYKHILKPIFFLYDPEKIHDRMTHTGSILGKCRIGRGITSVFFNYKNTMLEQKICGIHFPNPIGLSAGFDKNAQLTQIIPAMGDRISHRRTVRRQSKTTPVALKRVSKFGGVLRFQKYSGSGGCRCVKIWTFCTFCI